MFTGSDVVDLELKYVVVVNVKKQCKMKTEMKWIDVKERLPYPVDGKFMLCAFKSGDVKEMPMNMVKLSDYVTHWMPMPKPPKLG